MVFYLGAIRRQAINKVTKTNRLNYDFMKLNCINQHAIRTTKGDQSSHAP